MKPAPFIHAATVEEAVSVLAEHGDEAKAIGVLVRRAGEQAARGGRRSA